MTESDMRALQVGDDIVQMTVPANIELIDNKEMFSKVIAVSDIGVTIEHDDATINFYDHQHGQTLRVPSPTASIYP